MKLKIEGLDNAIRKLNDLQRRVEQVQGSHNIPVTELLTSDFMQRHTSFQTFEAMIKDSGFKVETSDDFKSIPDDQWDAYIARATRFSNWHAMLEAAGKEWVKKKLG